jgi:hypothetical protein
MTIVHSIMQLGARGYFDRVRKRRCRNGHTLASTNGAVPIDNNVIEREIKRVVLNRKNS